MVNLGPKITRQILLASTVVTSLALGVQFFQDYTSGVKRINNKVKATIDLQRDSLVRAVWDLNEAQTKSIIRGVVKAPNIQGVRIELADGGIYSDGVFEKGLNVIRSPIEHVYKNRNRKLGMILVSTTDAALIEEIKERALWVILSQTLKASVMVLLILYILRSQVVQRLKKIVVKIAKDALTGEIDGDEIDLLKKAQDLYAKRLVEETESAFKAREEGRMRVAHMAVGMAHQLNTPLNSLTFGLDLLKSEQDESARAAISSSCKKALNNAAEVIRLIKIIADSQTYQENAQEYTLIKRTFDDRLNQGETRIGKVIDKSNNASVKAPSQFLNYIADALISNAADAHKSQEISAEILVEIENANSDLVKITVKSIGKKLADDAVQNIVLPFYTTKTDSGALGLGLTIVREIVESFRGYLEYNFEEPHNCFSVFLPKSTAIEKSA